jgi:hypothetical protein
MSLMNFIKSSLTSTETKKETTTMAKPMLTEKMLADVRSQVRSRPFAGKGIFTIEQLENDAIIGLWNECAQAEKEALTLTNPAPTQPATKAS